MTRLFCLNEANWSDLWESYLCLRLVLIPCTFPTIDYDLGTARAGNGFHSPDFTIKGSVLRKNFHIPNAMQPLLLCQHNIHRAAYIAELVGLGASIFLRWSYSGRVVADHSQFRSSIVESDRVLLSLLKHRGKFLDRLRVEHIVLVVLAHRSVNQMFTTRLEWQPR